MLALPFGSLYKLSPSLGFSSLLPGQLCLNLISWTQLLAGAFSNHLYAKKIKKKEEIGKQSGSSFLLQCHKN